MEIVRSYKLSIYPNKGKTEHLEYTSVKYKKYVQHFINVLFYNQSVKFVSTSGMGQLANQAQHKANGLLKAQKEASKALNNKINCPIFSPIICPGKLIKSKSSTFDYWISFENQFSKTRVEVPCKSHKKLNQALREGWVLSEHCELHKQKNGNWQVLVYVKKEVNKPIPKKETIGCDVGYKYSVTRSDGHIGKNISKVIKKVRSKDAERRRQGHKKITPKSVIKQLLDTEAKQAVNVSRNAKKSLVVENPKVIANLRSGKLQGWARTYFTNRCQILGKEQEVFVWNVNPAYTSITCSVCGVTDKASRVKRDRFICTSCKSEFHADINAARNIARKGSESLVKYVIK